MNQKKCIALLLSLGLLLGLLSGCGQNKEPQDTAPETTQAPAPTQETESAEPSQEEVDEATQAVLDAFAAARAKHDPQEVVCTINGQEVTWDLYYYLLTDELLTVIYYTGGLPEDYTMALTEELTLEQYLRDTVLAKAKYYTLAHTESVARGAALSAEEEQEIEDYLARLTEEYGGEEALREAMAESNLSPELLRTILRSNSELTALMDSIYGAQGEKMTAEDVLSWAAEQGYIRVKHILYYFYNEDGTEMDEEGKAAQKQRAEDTLAELRAIEENEELEARFTERMNADSGDIGGLASFPEGYTFTSGTMYEVFEDAAFALEDYALSEVVESQSGYHVILRLPLDTEGATMDQDANTGAYMTLRQSAANELFSRNLAGWMEQAQVTWAEGFEDIDLNDLFDAPGPAAAEE